jgi:nuclear receptor interaction protein
MRYSLQDRLLKREYGDTSRYSKIRGIYADRQFVSDLDIVNELNGHGGCVNALRCANQGLNEGVKELTVYIAAGRAPVSF